MAAENKIEIKQGEAFILDLFVRDSITNNLSNFSVGFFARMQIRQDEDDATARDDLQTDDNTAANGRIVLGDGVPPTGETASEVANVVLTWDTAASIALKLNEGRGIQETYQGLGDLEIRDSSNEVVSSIRLVFAQTREVTLL